MLLSTPQFFIFLVLIFFAYWLVSRFRLAGLSVILFANYFFYARWDLAYLALIPLASTCDFCIGRALGSKRFGSKFIRRLLLGVSLALNVGLIVSLKYMPFVLRTWSEWAGAPNKLWPWALPLGVSFYAFQSLTYTIDIYRRDAEPCDSYLTYLAAVSFFPTTLAGPITRVAALVPQFAKTKLLEPADGGRALQAALRVGVRRPLGGEPHAPVAACDQGLHEVGGLQRVAVAAALGGRVGVDGLLHGLHVDEADLVGGRHVARLVLEAVARADVVDRDLVRKLHGATAP